MQDRHFYSLLIDNAEKSSNISVFILRQYLYHKMVFLMPHFIENITNNGVQYYLKAFQTCILWKNIKISTLK